MSMKRRGTGITVDRAAKKASTSRQESLHGRGRRAEVRQCALVHYINNNLLDYGHE